jgi:hypothetical protein
MPISLGSSKKLEIWKKVKLNLEIVYICTDEKIIILERIK